METATNRNILCMLFLMLNIFSVIYAEDDPFEKGDRVMIYGLKNGKYKHLNFVVDTIEEEVSKGSYKYQLKTNTDLTFRHEFLKSVYELSAGSQKPFENGDSVKVYGLENNKALNNIVEEIEVVKYDDKKETYKYQLTNHENSIFFHKNLKKLPKQDDEVIIFGLKEDTYLNFKVGTVQTTDEQENEYEVSLGNVQKDNEYFGEENLKLVSDCIDESGTYLQRLMKNNRQIRAKNKNTETEGTIDNFGSGRKFTLGVQESSEFPSFKECTPEDIQIYDPEKKTFGSLTKPTELEKGELVLIHRILQLKERDIDNQVAIMKKKCTVHDETRTCSVLLQDGRLVSIERMNLISLPNMKESFKLGNIKNNIDIKNKKIDALNKLKEFADNFWTKRLDVSFANRWIKEIKEEDERKKEEDERKKEYSWLEEDENFIFQIDDIFENDPILKFFRRLNYDSLWEFLEKEKEKDLEKAKEEKRLRDEQEIEELEKERKELLREQHEEKEKESQKTMQDNMNNFNQENMAGGFNMPNMENFNFGNMMNNPNAMTDMMNNPMIKGMMDNPMVQNMMKSFAQNMMNDPGATQNMQNMMNNPRTQENMQNMMNDPYAKETMQQMMRNVQNK